MCGLPQSRPIENDQSSVTMSPTAPAVRARSIRAAIVSLSPTQYIWKNVCGLAATTSSIGLLANELRLITVPRAAAARATATSPSGCTACTPVGEMITGSEIGWPMHGRGQVARRRQPRDVRREAELGERRDVVRGGEPCSDARDQRAVHRLGEPLLGAPLRLCDGLEPLVAHYLILPDPA